MGPNVDEVLQDKVNPERSLGSTSKTGERNISPSIQMQFSFVLAEHWNEQCPHNLSIKGNVKLAGVSQIAAPGQLCVLYAKRLGPLSSILITQFE